MKRILAIALSVFIAVGMMPAATTQAATSYNNKDVTWLGNSADYKLTINSMFDHGLRWVSIFYSDYNDKVGLVDVKGNFVVPPIYDSIHPQYYQYDPYYDEVLSNDDESLNMPAELLFIDGYVQATRDGKMGLLDTSGKEVIPCKYDAVGLPVEGMCRVILNNKLGYWSLERKKEVVAPKYILENPDDKTAAGAPRSITPLTDDQALVNPSTMYSANGKQTRLPAWFDFNGGYALVPMSTSDKNGLVKAQIIDKDGKQILNGGPYTYRSYFKAGATSYKQFNQQTGYTQYDYSNGYPEFEKDGGSYPQFGPYMDYQIILNKPLLILPDMHGEYLDSVDKFVSGVVGPKGVMIKPNYHGAIGRTDYDIDLWNPKTANLKVYPDMSLFATNCAPNKHEEGDQNGYLFGTFDLSTGKKILPTRGHYDPVRHLIWGNADYKNNNANPVDGFIYYANGKLVKYPNTLLFNMDSNTGCDKGYLGMFNSKGGIGLLNVVTGKKYTSKTLKIGRYDEYTAVSDAGTVLLEKGGKWGVVRISDGKLLAPFKYDITDEKVQETWGRSKNAYAIVNKGGKSGLIDVNGKEILSCKYDSIHTGFKYAIVQGAGGIGYFDFAAHKFVVPVQAGVPESDKEFAVLGATHSADGRLLKKDGTIVDAKLLDSTTDMCYPGLLDTVTEIESQLQAGYDTISVGPEGKFVLPNPADWSGISSYTVVVGDGKIGYINCIYLDWDGKTQSSDIQARLAEIQAKKDADKINASLTYNVVQKPTKLTYKYGDIFEIDGLEVESVDANGTRVKIDNSRIMLMFVNGDDRTKMWSAEWGGTGINYTIPLKKGTNVLKVFVDERDSGTTIDMELVN